MWRSLKGGVTSPSRRSSEQLRAAGTRSGVPAAATPPGTTIRPQARRPAGPLGAVRTDPFRTVDGEDTSAGTPGDARERVGRRRPVEGAGRPRRRPRSRPARGRPRRRRRPGAVAADRRRDEPEGAARPSPATAAHHDARTPPGGGRGRRWPALACVAAPVQPTGVGPTDVLLRFGFATWSRRWPRPGPARSTWIVLATGAVLLVALGSVVRRRAGRPWRWPWSPPSCPPAPPDRCGRRRAGRCPALLRARRRSGSPARPRSASGSRCCPCSCPATGWRRAGRASACTASRPRRCSSR